MSIISWEFSDLRIRFNLDKDLPEFKPSYNIAPGQQVPVIIREDGQAHALGFGSLMGPRSFHWKPDDQCALRDADREAFI